jgi:SAM-dependent methyltransferase
MIGAPMHEPDGEPATDRARLVGSAYATPGPLAARRALYAYERDPVDLATWVIDRMEHHRPLSEHCRVVDIGCGPGHYLAALRGRHPGITTIGLDLSHGMATAARAGGADAVVADAMQLPLRGASCDVAIAAHMLYHVPDVTLAAEELARIVDPTGVVAVVTNGRDHLAALDRLSRDAVAAVGGAPWTAPARSAARFLLDDAPALLEPALRVIGRERFSRAIVVTDPAPVVAYVDSEASLYRPALGTTWSDVLAEVEARVNAAIARDDAFTVHSDVGVLFARSS